MPPAGLPISAVRTEKVKYLLLIEAPLLTKRKENLAGR
jgi:hypothetical protein